MDIAVAEHQSSRLVHIVLSRLVAPVVVMSDTGSLPASFASVERLGPIQLSFRIMSNTNATTVHLDQTVAFRKPPYNVLLPPYCLVRVKYGRALGAFVFCKFSSVEGCTNIFCVE